MPKRQGLTRSKRIQEAIAIEREDAVRVGELAFYLRPFCNVGMPQGDPETDDPLSRVIWKRENGLTRLRMVADPTSGLPYGRIPRLLMAFITTEAIRKKDPHIDLGRTLTAFLEGLGLGSPTGGRNGNATRLRDQIRRLTSTTFHLTTDFLDVETGRRMWRNEPRTLGTCELWWSTRQPDQHGILPSFLDLSPDFFRLLVERPVPVDRRALRALTAVMAMDLYLWMTYRLSYLPEEREIPWGLLSKQFGHSYKLLSEFRRKLLKHLPEVLHVYPAARVAVGDHGLILRPSPPHVPFGLPS